MCLLMLQVRDPFPGFMGAPVLFVKENEVDAGGHFRVLLNPGVSFQVCHRAV